ncbi:unnamed protein product, partial [Wuchereria bancrofti]
MNNEFHQQKAENENLLKQKSDIEWQLSEHCERLRNANNRIAILEDELTHIKEINERTIEILRMENEALNQKKVIENLNNEFHQQKAENENLLKQKSDIEWQLSEHCERLRNANNRIAILEDELTHIKEINERTIEILRMENEALNQKNIQLKEDVKHLQDEIQNALINGRKEIEL